MPIAINGSGTLTGLSVGGLENGIITPAELSTGAPSWDAQYNLTNIASINNGPLAGFRNAIINGNFDVWQRGTSSSTNGYVAVDRWLNSVSGSTCTMSRQVFTLGQTDVPGEPTYFCRSTVTSVAGASNSARLAQAVESVRTLAGQQITISFWAKADASKQIAIELAQVFGTGGSPSAPVTGIGAIKKSLTTTWQKVTHTVTLPSISGKALGSDGNDHFLLSIWFDAGSTYNSRTDTLGQQSGTFDIAQVQVEAGPVATPFERRPIGTEIGFCQRYYQLQSGVYSLTYALAGAAYRQSLLLPVLMRTPPSVTTTTVSYANASTIGVAVNTGLIQFGAIATATGATSVAFNLALDAEL